MKLATPLLLASLTMSTTPLTAATTLSLDGQWQIADSLAADARPAQFAHRVTVPGLVNQAKPAFADVDKFESMEYIAALVRQKKLPESARIHTAGNSGQERNYFWHRKTFKAPAARAVARLRINKAQFGTAAWLNGQLVGTNAACFSSSNFDLSPAIRWGAENELVIRIGAHPGVLPVTFPAGSDFEKTKWTPGIYDSVSLHFCDNPVITSVQVAPRIATSEILVQTKIKNHGAATNFMLNQTVKPRKGAKKTVGSSMLELVLAAGEEHTVTQTVQIAEARLWSPDDPFLYSLQTTTDGDTRNTRFGMREFRGDAATGIFCLNGKPCYLRGSNIALHRFFEDAACGQLPWDEKWLRKMLVTIPRQMNWNSFRFCIGPVPDRWLEICDEEGLLIQNEFFIWTGAPAWDKNYARHWDATEMIRQYGDWMADNWNHPSVVIWDATNETEDSLFSEEVVPAVRGLDLSDRPWENSYNKPGAPGDAVESHPYLLQNNATKPKVDFHFTDLETLRGVPHDARPSAWYIPKEKRPIVINEYEWTWLNRDGSPTELTKDYYARCLPNSTARERFAWNAYVLGAETEFWRAHRHHAGVMHFVYLTCSFPGAFTSDNFLDVKKLRLEPLFQDYVTEAFKPLGVYLNFFQETLTTGTVRDFTVKLINDKDRAVKGELRLTLETESGKVLAETKQPFAMDAFGNTTEVLPLKIPAKATGKCLLRAAATPKGKGSESPTVSCRWVKL
jgi:beta-galactosidase/beta-glucuronidase